MSDVFVSYSRRDTEFVSRLADALRDGGRDVWVDTEGIADAEHFPDALRAAIEGADGFVFVITPSAATSKYCLQEVEHAQAMGKRIVPVLREPVADDQLHPEVRDRNWVPFTDDAAFVDGLERLDRALARDLAHAKAHTRLLTRALEWDAAGRSASLLPRGEDLAAAETWLAGAGPDAEPQPTPLQRDLLLAARRAGTRRQRRIVAISTAVAAISIVLLVVAMLAERSASHGRAVARRARTLASAEALAARSEAARAVSPAAAVRLAGKALETAPTDAAQRAAKAALDANPLQAVAGPFPFQQDVKACSFPGIAYRPGSDELALAACDGTVRLLDGRTGHQLRRWRIGPQPIAVAYSPDGRRLAVLVDKAVAIVDAASGRRVATRRLPGARLPRDGVQTSSMVVWSPDGGRLAATWGTGLFLVRRSGGVRRLAGGQPIWGSLSFAGNARLAIGTGDDTVEVYDGRSGAHLRTVPVSDGPRYAFAPQVVGGPDGRRVVIGRYTAGDVGRVEVWNARTWRREAILATTPFQFPQAVAISPDGSRVAYSSGPDKMSVVSARSGRALMQLPLPDFVASFAFSSGEGRRLAMMGGGPPTLRIARAQGPEARYLEGRSVRQDAIVASATRLRVVADPSAGGVRVESWRRGDGRRLPDLVVTRTGNRLVALSSDGRYLLETRPGVRDRPRVWDLERRRVVRRLPATRAGLLSLAPSGRVVIERGNYYTGGTDGPLLLTDLRGGPLRRTDGPDAKSSCGWSASASSADGTVIAGATACDNNVRLYDARTGRPTGTLHADSAVSGVALDRRGARAALLRSDGQLEVWDTHAKRRLRTLRGASGESSSPGFTPDGRRIVSATLRGGVFVWDVASGRLLRELDLPGLQLAQAYAGNDTLLLGDDRGAVRETDVCGACGNTDRLLTLTRRAGRLPLTSSDRALLAGG